MTNFESRPPPTPGQRALQEAIELRMREIGREHNEPYLIPIDWVVVISCQTPSEMHTYYHRETRGPGDVPVHAELGLLAWGQLRLGGAIAQSMGGP